MQFRSVSRTWAVSILALACFVGIFAPETARAEGSYRNRQLEKEIERVEKQAKEQEDAQYKKHGLLHGLKSLRLKGRTRVIVMLKPGVDGSQHARELSGKLARRFRFANFVVLDLPNGQLKKLARYSDVVTVHLDRDVYGDMTREASAIGARFVQEQFDLDGAGVVKVNLHDSAWRTPDDRVSFLDACAPELYTGNPISLASLATLPLTTHPAAILSGAMALGSGLRSRLATRFDCPVVDLYGITEAGLIAWRPDDGPHRLLPRRLHVEILSPSGSPCAPGERGEITVTCGENPLLPLLRYRTGDHAALSVEDGAPVLADLEGRDPVRYQAFDGHWVNSIELTHVLSPLGLVAWQLHQDATGAVTVEIHGEADLTTVESAVRSLLGAIPITASTTNLARDAKPQRYSSALVGALVV